MYVRDFFFQLKNGSGPYIVVVCEDDNGPRCLFYFARVVYMSRRVIPPPKNMEFWVVSVQIFCAFC